jgi:cytoskeletal protein CcmA (bactofilin family)
VSPKLLIEDGAFFQGECRMGDSPEAPPRPPRPGEGAE